MKKKKNKKKTLPLATEIMVPERSQELGVNRLMYSIVTVLIS